MSNPAENATLARPRWAVWCAGLAAAAGLSCAPSQAWSQTALKNLAVLRGTCSRLLVAKYDFTRGCSPMLTNQVYRNGRTSFTFDVRGATVTFSGIADQVKPNANTAIQPIDRIIWQLGPDIPAKPSVAVGKCTFGNPYLGPMAITCEATGAEGSYTGVFRTDGSNPSVREF